MKITIESTTKIVTLEIDGAVVPARVWQGETARGIPVQCFITRIAPEISKRDPNIDALTAEFEADLQRQADPDAKIVFPNELCIRANPYAAARRNITINELFRRIVERVIDDNLVDGILDDLETA